VDCSIGSRDLTLLLGVSGSMVLFIGFAGRSEIRG
jgi:hypothetical protein